MLPFEPVHEISNNVVCVTSKASDQPANMGSLIGASASRLSILGLVHILHSAILSNSIKLPFVIKIFVLSIFEWPLYTGFTVICCLLLYLFVLACYDSCRVLVDMWMSAIHQLFIVILLFSFRPISPRLSAIG